jgi:WD40 repeat protein
MWHCAAVLLVTMIPLPTQTDPLPEGAVARLGTTRFRHHGHVFAGFSEDGRSLLFVGPRTFHWVDLASGQQTQAVSMQGTAPPNDLQVRSNMAAKSSRVALVHDPGRIAIHDAATGEQLSLFLRGDIWKAKLPKASEQALLLLPDSEHLILAFESIQRTAIIVLFDAVTKQRLREFVAGKDNHFASLAMSDDGKTLAAIEVTAGASRLVVWELATGKLLQTVPLACGSSAHIQLLLGGKTMLAAFPQPLEEGATTGADAVKLIDTATGMTIREFTQRGMECSTFATSADGTTLYTSARGLVQAWNIATGKRGQAFRSQWLDPDNFFQPIPTPDGKHLVGMGDWTWTLWDAATGKELHATTGHLGPVGAVAYSPDSRKLLTASADWTARLWDVPNATQLHRLAIKPEGRSFPFPNPWRPESVEMPLPRNGFSANGQLMMSAGNSYDTHVWDTATGKLLHRLSCTQPPAMLPKLGLLAEAGPDGVMRFRQAATGKAKRGWTWTTLPARENVLQWGEPSASTAVAVSPDGTTLATHRAQSTADGKTETVIDLWNTVTGKKRTSLVIETAALDQRIKAFIAGEYFGSDAARRGIVALAFSPDAQQLAVATSNAIVLFNVASGREIRSFGGPRLFTPTLEFSPSGTLLAAGQLDGSIRLWDVATGSVLADVRGHALAVLGVAFSPDGQLLASASGDSTVLLWSVAELLKPPKAKVGFTAKDLEGLWIALANEDAEKAGQAMGALMRSPAQATAWFKSHLRPVVAANPMLVEQWLNALNDPKFSVRDRASAELAQLGELARSAMEKKLAAKPTLEMRKRLEALLSKLDAPVTRPEILRGLRAVEVLERIGTKEAMQILETIAGGAPDALVTRDARSAVQRLKQ